MKISIVGNGRLGQNLALELKKTERHIVEIYAKNTDKLDMFCSEYGFKPLQNLANLNTDLLIISVNDSAIMDIVDQLSKNIFVVHTSGSIPLDVLKKKGFVNCGVFYALYSFSKNILADFSDIPILIESSNDLMHSCLQKIASDLSNFVQVCTSKERERLHLVAVFVNNFVNYLWGESQYLAKELSVDFNLLRPILLQTAKKTIGNDDILSLQTGPAVRDDKLIIEKHLKQLFVFPNQKEIYLLLTKLIQENKQLIGK